MAAEAQAAPETAQPGGNQHTLRALGLKAKLTVSQPGDPDEQEADRVADAFVSGQGAPSLAAHGGAAIHRPCASCTDDAHIARTAGAAAPRIAGARTALGASRGAALSPHLQRDFGRFFNTDLSQVRVHTGAPAQALADALAAHAFTRGADIYFGRGRFDPMTGAGQHLLAHELAHTVQQAGGGDGGQRLQRAATCSVSGPPAANPETDKVVQAVRDLDVDTVVTAMKGKGVPELCALRAAVQHGTGIRLETWLMGLLNMAGALDIKKTGVTAEDGLRLILPVLPLIDRLELYDEGNREVEQAQLDTIRAASTEERSAVRAESARLEAVYAKMDIKEEYEARLLIDPEKKYAAAERVLARAPGFFSDDEDPVFDAIWALTPSERRAFWSKKNWELNKLLSAGRFKLLGALCQGTEAQALIARLQLATENRSDDMEAVQAVVDRAVALLAEQEGLRATLALATLPAEELGAAKARLDEFGELEALVKVGKGRIASGSFLGKLADAAGSPDAFGAIAQKLGTAIVDPAQQTEFAFATAKQRILMAASVHGADEDEVRNAFLELRAPPIADDAKLTPSQRDQKQAEANSGLRKRLLDDDDVHSVFITMLGSEQLRVLTFMNADAFVEQLTALRLALNGARWGEFFQIVLQIALRDDWTQRFEDTGKGAWAAMSAYAQVHGEQRDIMLDILKNKRIPTDKMLGFSGDVDTLRTALSNIDETERAQLRLGYLLSKRGYTPADKHGADAIEAYLKFDANLRDSQTTFGSVDRGGIEDVLDAALGQEPTAQEMATGEGMYNAAALMYERIEARLALERGASAAFTETDETMLAAGRQFAALWQSVRERQPPTVKAVELASLSALYDRFTHRAEQFTEASNAAGEVAGMIAATIAGVIIVAGTGGITAPAVIAAAAAGAGARVVTREMFGKDYYNPVGIAGGRDAVLGGIDAALAVIGGALGARGAELVGLGGKAFLTNAAKIAGEVAEQASGKLLHRVGAGAVETAIDGAFSGFVSEAANAMTDSRTWRRGVWRGLVTVGQAALAAGLVGLAGGALIGGALPVAGRGLHSALERRAGSRLAAALERAGAGESLASARRAALSGDVKTLDRLFAELETHLTGDQASLLRKRLYADLEASLGHPYGRAPLETPQEARLLAESAASPEVPTVPQREAEVGVVRRSDPQPSTVDGYVDEVDLGNGHTWRRRADGKWCRFSIPSLCGTQIGGAAPMPRARWDLPAPPGWKPKPATLASLPRDTVGNIEPLLQREVYEFPGGHKVWREGGGIRHESVLGPSTGRQHMEKEFFTATETELDALTGMERAHTLGQGTGFESPFGIYYAPREVNQLLQNHGVETYFRGLRDTARGGEAFHVSTFTSAHPPGLRLKEIRYRLQVERGGKKEFLFEYVITVGKEATNPAVNGKLINLAGEKSAAEVLGRVPVPENLQASWKEFLGAKSK